MSLTIGRNHLAVLALLLASATAGGARLAVAEEAATAAVAVVETSPAAPADSTLRAITRALRNTPAVRLRLRDREITSSGMVVDRRGVRWAPRTGAERWDDTQQPVVSWGEVVSIEASTLAARRGARRGAITGAVLGLAAGVGLSFVAAIDSGLEVGQLVGVAAITTGFGALTGAGVGGAIDAAVHAGDAKPDDSRSWRLVWKRE